MKDTSAHHRAENQTGPEEREVVASFVQACDRLEPLRPEASLLLGCSAGGDSMALLDLVHRSADDRRWKVTVAHFDHALRPASMAEADFVAERCAELDVPIIAEQWDAPDAAESRPSEEAMREARFAFFVRAMDRSGAETLALAHQADDRAETFLMRLLAGSGPTGLASIRSVETVKGLTVARPLLGIRRQRLRDYLRSRGLSWVDDPSNEDVTYKRAWVRRDVLPLFNERMGLEVIPRIVRAAELAEQESGAMRQACEILLGQITAPAEPPATEALLIHHEIWRGAGEPLRLQLLREWLWRLRTSPHPPGMAAVREALNFAERAADGSRLRTIERLHLLKRAGKLVAYPPEPTS